MWFTVIEICKLRRGNKNMMHLKWENNQTIKQIECIHANAKKFVVDKKLTPGKRYDVKNETEEFYFIYDDSNRIGGFHKYYFKEIDSKTGL